MPNRTIGTCSICGGAVVTPDVWLGIVPPTPECSSCGAHPKRAHGPVIEMERELGITEKMSTVLEAVRVNSSNGAIGSRITITPRQRILKD